jgi:hypothetical protein
MEVLSMNEASAILVARSNGGDDAINEQMRVLTKYAADNGIRVLGKVLLGNCSAGNYSLEATLEALLGTRRGSQRCSIIVVTDLSRLSRRGVPHAMHLIKKLAEAGVAVLTPDLGIVDEKLWRSFPPMVKGWARWGKGKSRSGPRTRKGCGSHASKKNPVARDDEDADARGDGPVYGRTPRPPRRNGPSKPTSEGKAWG